MTIKFLKGWFSGKTPDMHFYSLDPVRGLAALWVVGVHSVYGFPHYFQLGLSRVVDACYTVLGHGLWGVDAFFIVSGYCICISAMSHLDKKTIFLKRRFIRIYPAYWASIIVGVLFFFIFKKTGIGNSELMISKSDLLLILPSLFHQAELNYFNVVYWTLPHFVHFYILTLIAIVLTGKRFIYFFDIITLIFIMALSASVNFESSRFMDQTFILRYSWSRFYLGILLYRLIHDIHSLRIFYHVLCLALFIAVMYWNPTNAPLMTLSPFYLPCFFFLLILRIFDPLIKNSKVLNPFFKLGAISYSIYLVHDYFTPRLMHFAGRITVMNNYKTLFLIFCIIMPLALFCGYAFYLIFERPFTKYS